MISFDHARLGKRNNQAKIQSNCKPPIFSFFVKRFSIKMQEKEKGCRVFTQWPSGLHIMETNLNHHKV